MDALTCRHLERAVGTHMLWCRENAIDVPAEVRGIHDFLAMVGQVRPSLGEPGRVGDDAGVLLTITYDEADDRWLRASEQLQSYVLGNRTILDPRTGEISATNKPEHVNKLRREIARLLDERDEADRAYSKARCAHHDAQELLHFELQKAHYERTTGTPGS